MMSRTTFIALLSILTVGSTVVLAACAADEDDGSSGPSEDEVRSRSLGALGAACSATKKCKTGLTCKKTSNGPPPGAMGLPAPSSTSTSSGPPPGAVGLPAPPQNGTCKPSSSGPPPGAVGLPLPPSK